MWSSFVGDQWSVGAWDAMRGGAATHLPEHLRFIPVPDEPPQDLKEYDPEWGGPYGSGTVAAACDHDRMLRSVTVPSVLLTHRRRHHRCPARRDVRSASAAVRDLLAAAGVTVDYRSFPDVGHSMHGDRPALYVETLLDWVGGIGA